MSCIMMHIFCVKNAVQCCKNLVYAIVSAAYNNGYVVPPLLVNGPVYRQAVNLCVSFVLLV